VISLRPFRHISILFACCLLGLGVGSWSAVIAAEQEASPLIKDSAVVDKDADQWVDLPYKVTKATLGQLLAAPPTHTEDGFTAIFILKPGNQLYDPFDMYVVNKNTLWVADDGANGHVWQVTMDGRAKSLSAPARYSPYTLDVAPKSFGKYAGQIYALAFNEPNAAGGWELSDAITRIDPTTGRDTLVCYLPDNAAHEKGAGGFFVRFGPEDSPFAGKLWITTASNHSVYTVSPDGTCNAFAIIDLEKWGSPRGLAFTPDGKFMLIGMVTPSPANRAKTVVGGGKVIQMSPDGTFSDGPLKGGLREPGVMTFAPKSFGQYGGQLFITEIGDWDNDVGISQEPNKGPFLPVSSDGQVYRVTPEGTLALVACGFRNPVGAVFVDDSLVVSDINGDFHEGYQKLPDGFIVAIKALPKAK
jgi:hypothetical protein